MKSVLVGKKACSPLVLPNNTLIEHNDVNATGKEMPLFDGDGRAKAIAFRRNKGSLSGVGNAALQLLAHPRGDAGWMIDGNELVLSSKTAGEQ